MDRSYSDASKVITECKALAEASFACTEKHQLQAAECKRELA